MLTGKRNRRPNKAYIGSDSDNGNKTAEPKRKNKEGLSTELGLKSKRQNKLASKKSKNFKDLKSTQAQSSDDSESKNILDKSGSIDNQPIRI